MKELRTISIDIIKKYQHESGAYVASPNFPNYGYSWLRDGSFVAYAMLEVGEVESCEKFLAWVDGVIRAQRDRIERVVAAHEAGRRADAGDYLPARYNLDGTVSHDDWPNFQLDGYGAWLWLLGEYLRRADDETNLHRYRESIRLTLDYLQAVWSLPNFDCWEENGDTVHPATLACLYGGINAINTYLGEKKLTSLAAEIRDAALALAIDGRFRKMRGSESVDASLIWLSTPFNVVAPDDRRMRKTIRMIETRLLVEGGVRRYPEDTYYGGGRWLLLTCWLGWYYAQTGKKEKAWEMLRWVAQQSNEKGWLPEQQLDRLAAPEYRIVWEKRWGPVATPLLWSHAMYLILRNELDHSAHQEKHTLSKEGDYR